MRRWLACVVGVVFSLAGLSAQAVPPNTFVLFFTDDQNYLRVTTYPDNRVLLEALGDKPGGLALRNAILSKKDFFDQLWDLTQSSRTRTQSYEMPQQTLIPTCALHECTKPKAMLNLPSYLRERPLECIFGAFGLMAGLYTQAYLPLLATLGYLGVSAVAASYATTTNPKVAGNILESFGRYLLLPLSYHAGVSLAKLRSGFQWGPAAAFLADLAGLIVIPMVYSHAKIFHHRNGALNLAPQLRKLVQHYPQLIAKDPTFPDPVFTGNVSVIWLYGRSSRFL